MGIWHSTLLGDSITARRLARAHVDDAKKKGPDLGKALLGED